MSSTKTYYAKGATMYGKGAGKFVCKATAAKMRGAHMGAMGAMMHSTKTHGMSGPATRGSVMPGAMTPGTPATPGAMTPGTSATPGAMTPGSMASPGAMTPGSTASPGAMATPREQNKPGAVSPTAPAMPAASPGASMGSPQPRPT